MNDPIGKYTLISADEIIDDWVAAFQVLSLPQFNRFQEMVDYPSEAPSELMEIAREFVTNTLSYLRIPNPLMRPELLNLDMKAADDPAIDPLPTWWHLTFSQLEAIGCAKVVYQWGQKVRARRRKQTIFPHVWDSLLIRWAESEHNAGFPAMDLPETTINKLAEIVLNSQEVYRKNQAFVDHVSTTTTDKWEQFMLGQEGSGAWIKLVYGYTNYVAKWAMIASQFSQAELDAINAWGLPLLGPNYQDDLLAFIETVSKLP